METSWFDLLPRISGIVFALGALLLGVSLLFLRAGRRGETWRRRTTALPGGRLLVFSVSLWMGHLP